MAELTYRDAVARGIAQEMARDPDVVFLGEDVAKAGGVFNDDFIDSYIELKKGEADRFRMTPHPLEFVMYYSL